MDVDNDFDSVSEASAGYSGLRQGEGGGSTAKQRNIKKSRQHLEMPQERKAYFESLLAPSLYHRLQVSNYYCLYICLVLRKMKRFWKY